jgi:sterol desaturase/sphingolipid hydroxylase (fatty acid hydroxylase superfamily)
MHIPKGRRLERTFWFRWLDSHHHMHHKRHFNNLNVVLPLADILFGTLIPARQHLATPDREAGAEQVSLLLSAS